MTPECWARLNRLRANKDFQDISLEALLWECVRTTSVQETKMILSMIETEIDFASKSVDDKLREVFTRVRIANAASKD